MTSDGVLAEYRAAGTYRWLLLLWLLCVVALLAWIWVAAPSAGAAAFRCALTAVPLGWLVYGFGFRIADRLALTADELIWHARLAHGRVPLSEVRSMTDALPVLDAVRITIVGSWAVLVRVGGGLADLERRAASLAPHIRVEISARQEGVETWAPDGYSDER